MPAQTSLVQLAVSTPLLPGQTNPVPGVGVAVSVTWTAATGTGPSTLALVGAQTYVVDLAMIPATGLQSLWVSVDTIDVLGGTVTTEVKFAFTGGLLWIPPGGGFALASPKIATGGITALSVVTTANATVHIMGHG